MRCGAAMVFVGFVEGTFRKAEVVLENRIIAHQLFIKFIIFLIRIYPEYNL